MNDDLDALKVGLRAVLGNQASLFRAMALLLESNPVRLYKAAGEARDNAIRTDSFKKELFPSPQESDQSKVRSTE